MYKAASRNEQFMGLTGSFSDRLRARGFAESNNPIEILPTLKEQYDALKVRMRSERDPQLKQDLIRQIGDYRRILEDGTRLAFEAIFVSVAQARLPKDYFLTLVEEARSYWRQDGFADCVPPITRKAKHKNVKRRVKEMINEGEKH